MACRILHLLILKRFVFFEQTTYSDFGLIFALEVYLSIYVSKIMNLHLDSKRGDVLLVELITYIESCYYVCSGEKLSLHSYLN